MQIQPRRILIFRLGSIGDFVIALPCFHLIRETYPDAEIVLLTNLPANDRVVPAEAVLQGTGLVDRYIRYPGGTRDFRQLRALRQEIVALAPDMLIYLTEPRGAFSIYRDYLFFRWCRIRRLVGLSPFRIHYSLSPIAGSDLREPESRRLGRQLLSIGTIDFQRASAWDLHLSQTEMDEAAKLLNEAFPDRWRKRDKLIGFSLGTKQPINNWGDDNWRSVLESLGSLDFGLVIVGGGEDRLRSQKLTDSWPGPILNLCGRSSPRISAAVLSQVRLFLCHDSGPMHLAASVGTPCVAIFSRRNLPGKWFPSGAGHRVLYPTASSGSIAFIRPRQAVVAAVDVLGASRPAAANHAMAL